MSKALQTALATANQAQLAEAATRWATGQANGEPIDNELAVELLTELAKLARTPGKQLYCWTT